MACFAYEDKLVSTAMGTVLIAFIPMIMGSGGNAGGQTSVTIIRGLALEEIKMRDIFRILFKELRVSLLCGITLSIATFAKMLLIDWLILKNITGTFPEASLVCFVVSLTLLVTIIASKLVGCVLPVLAKRLGFDPAVMASPFITTIVDVLSLLIYFGIAFAIL